MRSSKSRNEDWDRIVSELRQNRLGLSLDGFAKLLDVSVTTVWRWEQGETVPRPAQRAKLELLMDKPGDASMGRRRTMVELMTKFVSGTAGRLGSKFVDFLTDRLVQVRTNREKRNVYRFTDVSLPTETPQWVYTLRDFFRRQAWEPVYAFGLSVISLPCPTRARVWAQQMIAVSAFHLGHYEEAVEIIDPAILDCDDDVLLADLYANKAGFLARLGEYKHALRTVDKCLAIDKSNLIGHYNGVCTATFAKDDEEIRSRAKELKKKHPDAADPDSTLGQNILEDPDLKYFRKTQVFRKLFPKLAERCGDVGEGGSVGSVLLLVVMLALLLAVAAYILVPGSALALMFGNTKGAAALASLVVLPALRR